MPDYTVGDTVYKRFTTRAFATGIPTTLAGTPVVSAYEDDSATQITAGITLGVDHDTVTGLNLLTIVATGANGFEAGKSYDLVITTGTVGGVSVVGEVVWHFTLSAEAAAVDLANGTDGLGALKTLIDTIDDFLDTEIAAILVDTGTTLQGELDGIQADTEDIQTRLPAALVGGRMDSNVGAINGDTTAPVNLARHALTTVLVTFTTAGSSTTVAILNQVDGAAASATNDFYNGRVLIFITGSNKYVATDITDYVGATKAATITAVPNSVADTMTAVLI